LTENAAKLVAKDKGAYDSTFFSELLRSPYAQKQIGGHTGQVTIGKLALFRIEKLKIILPPLPLQRSFAVRVAGIRAMEVQQAESRRRLDTLFQSLLHRAFQRDL
jgi:type I restriction enzyme S subunit